MPNPLVDQVATESLAVISKWELGLGNLVTIKIPEYMPPDEMSALIHNLGEWWRSNAPYFRGAKMLILQPGAELGVQTDASLRELGYVRKDEVKA